MRAKSISASPASTADCRCSCAICRPRGRPQHLRASSSTSTAAPSPPPCRSRTASMAGPGATNCVPPGSTCGALDFHGFGQFSDPLSRDGAASRAAAPLGRAEDASRQLERAVRFIIARHGVERISLVAHSWGTHRRRALRRALPRSRRAPGALRPDRAARAARRSGCACRLAADLAAGSMDPLHRDGAARRDPRCCSRRHFDEWGERYLDSDPGSRTRSPACGEGAERRVPGHLRRLGRRASHTIPRCVRAPVAIIRGEWDSMCTDADARWLFDASRGIAAAPRHQDRPRHASDASRSRAATRCIARRRRSWRGATNRRRDHPAGDERRRRHIAATEGMHVCCHLRSPAESRTLGRVSRPREIPEAGAGEDRRLHRQRALRQPAQRGPLVVALDVARREGGDPLAHARACITACRRKAASRCSRSIICASARSRADSRPAGGQSCASSASTRPRPGPRHASR